MAEDQITPEVQRIINYKIAIGITKNLYRKEIITQDQLHNMLEYLKKHYKQDKS